MIGSLFVTGPAGTGKSTFCASMKDWLLMQGYDAAVVNLDPGADFVPYEPDIDVRDMISIDEVMAQYSLGPNGAQVVAADLLVENMEEITKKLEELQDYYVIFDTPGQIELFSFRPGSAMMVQRLSSGKAMIAFLADGVLCQYPSGYISQKMLYASVMSRMFYPMLFVINKTDLMDEDSIQNAMDWEKDPEKLDDAFLEEKGNILKDYYSAITKSFRDLSLVSKLFMVSSRDMMGFEGIYAEMSMYFRGGEDVDTMYKDE